MAATMNASTNSPASHTHRGTPSSPSESPTGGRGVIVADAEGAAGMAVGVAVGLGVAVGCGAGGGVGVATGCGTGVAVGAGESMRCGTGVAVGAGAAAVGIAVGAGEPADCGAGIAVGTGVAVGVAVGLGVGAGVGVGVDACDCTLAGDALLPRRSVGGDVVSRRLASVVLGAGVGAGAVPAGASHTQSSAATLSTQPSSKVLGKT